MAKPIIIAIDGPAAAGKSTVAQMLANRLGLNYLDSGATYRAAALKVLEAGVAPDDQAAVAALIGCADIGIRADGSQVRVILDGRDVSGKLRAPEVSVAASKISRFPEVRSKLVGLQRRVAAGPGVVMEGRDIGTRVFPEAQLKIFLIADQQERARRRMNQEKKSGRGATLAQTEEELRRRDRLDSEREISPLRAAGDAVRIDSTTLTPDQVVNKVMKLARERGLV
jgi:CMP/dCMP kinase